MATLEWAPLAVADLVVIVDYIATDNLDAAQRLKDAIDAKTATLPQHPHRFRRGRVEGTREIVVWASYVVVYEARPDGVRILRVLHAARQWPPAEG